jgi:hypothetical protein
VIVLNTLLLLIVLNVAAQLYLDAKSARAKSKHDARDVFAHRAYDPSLAPLYPGLDEGQISELIKETRKLTQEYDSYTQFKERPVNAKYVKVYPEGFRNGKNQAQWPPDKTAFNIFVFGGSTCFGYRVADDSTIPSHLQELIRRETNLPAAVYNFGRGGYISTQERALFEKLILQGHIPSMAIFIDGLNDLSVPSGEPIHTKDLRKLMDTDETPKWDSCFQALPVAKLILNTSKSEGRDRKEHDAQSTNSEEAYEKRAHTIIERYRTNKKMIDAIAKTFKIIPAFVWQPVPVYGYEQQYNLFGKFNFDGKVPLLRPGYRVMASENQSGSLGDNFIWCADIQRNLRKPLYVDAVHYSGEMCALIARDIFNKLRQKGLLAFK